MPSVISSCPMSNLPSRESENQTMPRSLPQQSDAPAPGMPSLESGIVAATRLHEEPGRRITLLPCSSKPAADARHDECLLEQVSGRGPVAAMWRAPQSLVVPRSYRRHENLDQVCERFAARGWPVTLRQTGGGIVPQGPGILNLSLAYAVKGPPMQHSEAGYELICGVLAKALRALGVESFPAAVEGAFCDGRYNLAVHHQGRATKIAGTAQSWRRLPGKPDVHLGLVHALVLLEVDAGSVTSVANAFEAALGSGRQYFPEKVVSLATLLNHPPGLQERFLYALAEALSVAVLPD